MKGEIQGSLNMVKDLNYNNCDWDKERKKERGERKRREKAIEGLFCCRVIHLARRSFLQLDGDRERSLLWSFKTFSFVDLSSYSSKEPTDNSLPLSYLHNLELRYFRDILFSNLRWNLLLYGHLNDPKDPKYIYYYYFPSLIRQLGTDMYHNHTLPSQTCENCLSVTFFTGMLKTFHDRERESERRQVGPGTIYKSNGNLFTFFLSH